MRGLFTYPDMRRWQRLARQMAGGHRHHPGCGDRARATTEQRIAFLEEYQRDLEEQVADVAAEIKRLQKEMAGTTDSASD